VGLAGIAFAREHRIRSLASFREIGPGAQLAVVALAMSVSWFTLLALAHATGLELPFVRTAVPAIWIGMVALVAAVPRGKLEHVCVALLVPGLVWGSVMWSRAVHDGHWERVTQASRNDVHYGTTPATIRDLSSIGADRIVCSGWDTWVCRLVAPNLARSGVTVVPIANVTYTPSLRCALGSRRPPHPWEVKVYREGRLLGVLCH